MISAFLESWSHESAEYPIIDVRKRGRYHNDDTTRKRMWVNARVRNLCAISVPYKSSRDAQDDERVLHTDGNRTSDSGGTSTQGNLFAIATLHNGIYELHGMRGHVPAERAWGNRHQRFGHERVKGLQRFQSKRLVNGLIMMPSPVNDCPACIEAKQSKLPLSSAFRTEDDATG